MLLPALLFAVPVYAAIFATLKGVVHDPQHRPVPGATVVVKALNSEWTSTVVTGPDGEFQFAAVPLGEYAVTVSLQGFTPLERTVTLVSDTSPVLHMELQVAGLAEAVTVSAQADEARARSAAPTTLVSRQDIQDTPGADRTNSLEAFTAYVPGSYVIHDQLHMRGGHQVSWLIDGVPVPNTNIASNVGPQFDPKDIDYLEVHRGSYEAEYGDRTYGVFNVVPRSGFERDNDAEVVLTGGSFTQTNDQISVGGHTQRFAYFSSGNVNRSNLGLGTPVPDVLHDRQSGGGGFGSLLFNATPSNQLRVVTSVRHDVYQIPNDAEAQAAGADDVERESDGFVNLSWVRTWTSGRLLTVSPFYHYNSANFHGGPLDVPVSTTDERGSHYAGLQTTFTTSAGARHQVEVGFYGFHQRDRQRLGLTFSDPEAVPFSVVQQPSGSTTAFFAQETFSATSWLTLTAGVRQTHFSGAITENATSPRVGVTAALGRSNITVRGFYGRFYQEPPLVTASGPLVELASSQDLSFIPLHGERDEEYQTGITVPVRGWTIDADRFETRATDFFDHNPIGNSNIFFPVTIEGAVIRGTELTIRSPRTWKPGQFHLAYSFQTARGHGAVTGGLTDFEEGESGDFPLDHDQRHTFSAGFDAHLPKGVFGSVNVSYGSGFPDDEGPEYLPGHTTVNLSAGKTLSEKLSLSVTALNVANQHVLVDNSLTFGGTHYNSPREVYAELRFRFHY
jgi:outer membrane receptor protein involved in Fe transport